MKTLRTPTSTRARARACAGGDDGNAVVEFLGAALLLLVPLVYLVLVLARLQAATFAAEGAAREAGRSFAISSDVEAGTRTAVLSTDLALDDQGFVDVDPAQALVITCSTDPCLKPGGDVTAVVSFDVALPFVPDFVRGVVPLSIPVSARHVSPIDTFAERP